jgi:hypothetical protein
MGMLKKGSRLLIVDGIEYRWRVRNKPTYSQGLTSSPLILAIEQASNPGAKLVAELPSAHPSNWMLAPLFLACLPTSWVTSALLLLRAGVPMFRVNPLS